MKAKLMLLTAAFGLAAASGRADILISGIVDGTQSGGLPKALEIVAMNDVADLSAFWISRDTNGAGPWDTFAQLPSVPLNSGEFFYVTGSSGATTSMTNLGFTVGLEDGILNQNGDDIIGLATGSNPVDVFDSIGVVGQGDTNFYENSFAVRKASSTTPSISDTDGANFNITAYTDAGLTGPNGFGSYAIPEPSTFILVAITGLAAFGVLRRNKK